MALFGKKARKLAFACNCHCVETKAVAVFDRCLRATEEQLAADLSDDRFDLGIGTN